ncbi:CYTH and CHAD domain-containing protein [Flexibacterium corallicola]|uniref:CYTH and CHAD domain-containing protein n=1 Tax=Flexibacterium corallicola TaxID=3037259 RepID=UPI00286F56C8|nr:CYTH and CHAD domain-containing protein [Pseudovibrio sp. M1P-2-3]
MSKREIELKLMVNAGTLKRLRDQSGPKGYAVASATLKKLRSVYFDSENHDFRSAKTTLRVRQIGPNWIQTVKAGRTLNAGLSSTMEYESDANGPLPDASLIPPNTLSKKLMGLIDQKRVGPVFETEIYRAIKVFSTNEGDEIEVSFDIGEARAGKKQAPISEVELELTQGSPRALYSLAKHIIGSQSFTFSMRSKADLGYRLARNQPTLPPTSSKEVGRLSLTKDMKNSEAFQLILRACMERIVHARGQVIDGDHHCGTQQLHQALNLLSATFVIYKDMLDKDQVKPLASIARHLIGRVLELRKRETVASDTVASLETASPLPESLELILSHACEALCSSQRDLRMELRRKQTNGFLFDLGSFIEVKQWKEHRAFQEGPITKMPLEEFARETMRKRWKACLRGIKGITKRAPVLENGFDRNLKRFISALDIFGSLFPPESTEPFIKTLSKVQASYQLAAYSTVCERFLLQNSSHILPESEVLMAHRFIADWHKAQTSDKLRELVEDWEHLQTLPKFWKMK